MKKQLAMIQAVLGGIGAVSLLVAAIGIANQRATTIIWDRYTGQPIYNAIVWQCRRSAPIIEELKKNGCAQYIQAATGLIPDAYFSGSKIKWILDVYKRQPKHLYESRRPSISQN